MQRSLAPAQILGTWVSGTLYHPHLSPTTYSTYLSYRHIRDILDRLNALETINLTILTIMESPPSLTAIEDQPLSAPPPGVIPNLENPQSRAFELFVTASVCLPLIIFFASLRLYAKVAILKKWTWDDSELTHRRLFILMLS